MKNFAKIAALSMVMLSVNAYSQTEDNVTIIAGDVVVKKGERMEIKNQDCVVTGSLRISTGIGTNGEILVYPDRTLEIKGGILGWHDTNITDGKITVNGTLKATKDEDGKYPLIRFANLTSVDNHITLRGSGVVDLSPLRSIDGDSDDFEREIDLSNNIFLWKTVTVNKVILPYNCKFSGIDLSKCTEVAYVMVTQSEKSGPEINDEKVIVKHIYWKEGVWGKYLNNETGKGVVLPNNVKVETINKGGEVVPLKLSELAADTTTYNKTSLKLQTNDLDEVSHVLSSDTAYNFGLVGKTAINVSGDYVLMLIGDNSEYTPDGNSLTLPSVVEFKGNNSLFPITKTYGIMKFVGNCENTVAEGTIVKAETGLYVDAESTLNVEGTLII